MLVNLFRDTNPELMPCEVVPSGIQFLSSPYAIPATNLQLGGGIESVRNVTQTRDLQRSRHVLYPRCQVPFLIIQSVQKSKVTNYF